jgi:hypothetical protein
VKSVRIIMVRDGRGPCNRIAGECCQISLWKWNLGGDRILYKMVVTNEKRSVHTFSGQCSKTPKVTSREFSQVHNLINQLLPTQGKIVSVACYHFVIGKPRLRLIQHDLDYSDSLFFCSDT